MENTIPPPPFPSSTRSNHLRATSREPRLGEENGGRKKQNSFPYPVGVFRRGERERDTPWRGGGGFASIEQFFSLKFDVRRKDDERRDPGWRPRLQQLLTALPALHAPRSREGSGEICGASRNREIEFANFWIGAEVVGREEGEGGGASRFSRSRTFLSSSRERIVATNPRHRTSFDFLITLLDEDSIVSSSFSSFEGRGMVFLEGRGEGLENFTNL